MASADQPVAVIAWMLEFVLSIEAYARGSSSVLLCSTHSGAALGERAGVAKPETTEPGPASAAAPTASGGFSGATLREEPSLADSQGCNGSGVDSFSAGRVPAVAAQPWEAQIESKMCVLPLCCGVAVKVLTLVVLRRSKQLPCRLYTMRKWEVAGSLGC